MENVHMFAKINIWFQSGSAYDQMYPSIDIGIVYVCLHI